MALEDAAVLGEMLARRGPLGDTLSRWVSRRRRRVRWVQNQSRRIGRVAQWSHPLACRLRDALARALPHAGATRAVIRLAEQDL